MIKKTIKVDVNGNSLVLRPTLNYLVACASILGVGTFEQLGTKLDSGLRIDKLHELIQAAFEANGYTVALEDIGSMDMDVAVKIPLKLIEMGLTPDEEPNVVKKKKPAQKVMRGNGKEATASQ